MAFITDYTGSKFFSEENEIKSISNSFYSDEEAVLSFVVFSNTSKKIEFAITPMINAISFTPVVDMEKNNEFKIKINASLLPKSWNADLLIKDLNVVSRVNINFSRKD